MALISFRRNVHFLIRFLTFCFAILQLQGGQSFSLVGFLLILRLRCFRLGSSTKSFYIHYSKGIRETYRWEIVKLYHLICVLVTINKFWRVVKVKRRVWRWLPLTLANDFIQLKLYFSSFSIGMDTICHAFNA